MCVSLYFFEHLLLVCNCVILSPFLLRFIFPINKLNIAMTYSGSALCRFACLLGFTCYLQRYTIKYWHIYITGPSIMNIIAVIQRPGHHFIKAAWLMSSIHNCHLLQHWCDWWLLRNEDTYSLSLFWESMFSPKASLKWAFFFLKFIHYSF